MCPLELFLRKNESFEKNFLSFGCSRNFEHRKYGLLAKIFQQFVKTATGLSSGTIYGKPVCFFVFYLFQTLSGKFSNYQPKTFPQIFKAAWYHSIGKLRTRKKYNEVRFLVFLSLVSDVIQNFPQSRPGFSRSVVKTVFNVSTGTFSGKNRKYLKKNSVSLIVLSILSNECTDFWTNTWTGCQNCNPRVQRKILGIFYYKKTNFWSLSGKLLTFFR